MNIMINSNKSNRCHCNNCFNKDAGSVVRFILFVILLVVAVLKKADADAAAAAALVDNQYIIVGVSGGLQKGFPDHSKLDYVIIPPHHNDDHDNDKHKENNGVIQGVFLGRALVRGYKAYLDVMEPTHRQYVSPTSSNQQPLINSNVMATGCWHHANEYWMYLVDSRQALSILMNEPRFLSITPDHGLVDLMADETSPVIKHIAKHEIARQNKTDYSVIAFPIVTSVWYNPTSHVPSPVLYIKEEDENGDGGGTEVTNFPQSLLKWIGLDPKVDTKTCQADVGAYIDEDISTPLEIATFWTAVTKSIRHAEANRANTDKDNDDSPSSLAAACTKKAQFGTSPQQARINYPFDPHDFQRLLQTGGYDIDYVNAKVVSLSSSSSSS